MNMKHKILQQNYKILHSADGHCRGHPDPRCELCLYLKGVAEARDVPSYVKDHPFGQPAVTSAHPHWEFYPESNNLFSQKGHQR
ncbi:hypothetical protein PHAVU_003G026400 [Phaseolus vulgaris]|uniref:Uncharacterized protein n=1 Tax=Phaseolus vulgaris TaxID=3885 RepID=V7C8T6_PHAVU|nr:hypothetical protein PHAVU_003G026400g [Phaseolus vulgaris]ESW25326.1 hypothetical protein PHAVU_003G026400g [Phaseolus vulgaris]